MEIHMKISYFSWLRTKTGIPNEEIALPVQCRTVDDLVRHLAARYPALAEIADARGSMRFTVNRRYVENSHELASDDEVGLFPPVTGG
jgi:molybdopterin synthase sulfur carrier subunit